MKADTRLMKQLNISTLRRVLSGEGKATKPQLSRLTGLSVVTVNALITEMLEQGEVQELGNGTLRAEAVLPCSTAIVTDTGLW